jgi:hypothetical protein
MLASSRMYTIKTASRIDANIKVPGLMLTPGHNST